jgi:thiol-disulfide isomerase/thioredoxin
MAAVTRRPGIGLALALLWLVSACAPPGNSAAPEQAIPFELTRLDGTRVRGEELRGRHLLLDFWATWCPPCILEIPERNAIYERYRDQGFEILAISVDDLPPDELESWLRDNGVQYPVALGSEELARRYGGFGFPFHVLISPEGHILERLTPGFHDREEIGALLERHLSG